VPLLSFCFTSDTPAGVFAQLMAEHAPRYPRAADVLLSAAIAQLPVEADPLSVMSRRGALAVDALAACIRAGRCADVAAVLDSAVMQGALAEQGSVVLGVVSAIAQLADVASGAAGPGLQDALMEAWAPTSPREPPLASADGAISVRTVRCMDTAEEVSRLAQALALHLPQGAWPESFCPLVLAHLPELPATARSAVVEAFAEAQAAVQGGDRDAAARKLASTLAEAYQPFEGAPRTFLIS
jgi:hypothetical protein